MFLSQRVVLAQHQSGFVIGCLNSLSQFTACLTSEFIDEFVSGYHFLLDFHQVAVLLFIVALFNFVPSHGAVCYRYLRRLSAFQQALLRVLDWHVYQRIS